MSDHPAFIRHLTKAVVGHVYEDLIAWSRTPGELYHDRALATPQERLEALKEWCARSSSALLGLHAAINASKIVSMTGESGHIVSRVKSIEHAIYESRRNIEHNLKVMRAMFVFAPDLDPRAPVEDASKLLENRVIQLRSLTEMKRRMKANSQSSLTSTEADNAAAGSDASNETSKLDTSKNDIKGNVPVKKKLAPVTAESTGTILHHKIAPAFVTTTHSYAPHKISFQPRNLVISLSKDFICEVSVALVEMDRVSQWVATGVRISNGYAGSLAPQVNTLHYNNWSISRSGDLLDVHSNDKETDLMSRFDENDNRNELDNSKTPKFQILLVKLLERVQKSLRLHRNNAMIRNGFVLPSSDDNSSSNVSANIPLSTNQHLAVLSSFFLEKEKAYAREMKLMKSKGISSNTGTPLLEPLVPYPMLFSCCSRCRDHRKLSEKRPLARKEMSESYIQFQRTRNSADSAAVLAAVRPLSGFSAAYVLNEIVDLVKKGYLGVLCSRCAEVGSGVRQREVMLRLLNASNSGVTAAEEGSVAVVSAWNSSLLSSKAVNVKNYSIYSRTPSIRSNKSGISDSVVPISSLHLTSDNMPSSVGNTSNEGLHWLSPRAPMSNSCVFFLSNENVYDFGLQSNPPSQRLIQGYLDTLAPFGVPHSRAAAVIASAERSYLDPKSLYHLLLQSSGSFDRVESGLRLAQSLLLLRDLRFSTLSSATLTASTQETYKTDEFRVVESAEGVLVREDTGKYSALSSSISASSTAMTGVLRSLSAAYTALLDAQAQGKDLSSVVENVWKRLYPRKATNLNLTASSSSDTISSSTTVIPDNNRISSPLGSRIEPKVHQQLLAPPTAKSVPLGVSSVTRLDSLFASVSKALRCLYWASELLAGAMHSIELDVDAQDELSAITSADEQRLLETRYSDRNWVVKRKLEDVAATITELEAALFALSSSNAASGSNSGRGRGLETPKETVSEVAMEKSEFSGIIAKDGIHLGPIHSGHPLMLQLERCIDYLVSTRSALLSYDPTTYVPSFVVKSNEGETQHTFISNEAPRNSAQSPQYGLSSPISINTKVDFLNHPLNRLIRHHLSKLHTSSSQSTAPAGKRGTSGSGKETSDPIVPSVDTPVSLSAALSAVRHPWSRGILASMEASDSIFSTGSNVDRGADVTEFLTESLNDDFSDDPITSANRRKRLPPTLNTSFILSTPITNSNVLRARLNLMHLLSVIPALLPPPNFLLDHIYCNALNTSAAPAAGTAGATNSSPRPTSAVQAALVTKVKELKDVVPAFITTAPIVPPPASRAGTVAMGNSYLGPAGSVTEQVKGYSSPVFEKLVRGAEVLMKGAVINLRLRPDLIFALHSSGTAVSWRSNALGSLNPALRSALGGNQDEEKYIQNAFALVFPVLPPNNSLVLRPDDAVIDAEAVPSSVAAGQPGSVELLFEINPLDGGFTIRANPQLLMKLPEAVRRATSTAVARCSDGFSQLVHREAKQLYSILKNLQGAVTDSAFTQLAVESELAIEQAISTARFAVPAPSSSADEPMGDVASFKYSSESKDDKGQLDCKIRTLELRRQFDAHHRLSGASSLSVSHVLKNRNLNITASFAEPSSVSARALLSLAAPLSFFFGTPRNPTASASSDVSKTATSTSSYGATAVPSLAGIMDFCFGHSSNTVDSFSNNVIETKESRCLSIYDLPTTSNNVDTARYIRSVIFNIPSTQAENENSNSVFSHPRFTKYCLALLPFIRRSLSADVANTVTATASGLAGHLHESLDALMAASSSSTSVSDRLLRALNGRALAAEEALRLLALSSVLSHHAAKLVEAVQFAVLHTEVERLDKEFLVDLLAPAQSKLSGGIPRGPINPLEPVMLPRNTVGALNAIPADYKALGSLYRTHQISDNVFEMISQAWHSGAQQDSKRGDQSIIKGKENVNVVGFKRSLFLAPRVRVPATLCIENRPNGAKSSSFTAFSFPDLVCLSVSSNNCSGESSTHFNEFDYNYLLSGKTQLSWVSPAIVNEVLSQLENDELFVKYSKKVNEKIISRPAGDVYSAPIRNECTWAIRISSSILDDALLSVSDLQNIIACSEFDSQSADVNSVARSIRDRRSSARAILHKIISSLKKAIISMRRANNIDLQDSENLRFIVLPSNSLANSSHSSSDAQTFDSVLKSVQNPLISEATSFLVTNPKSVTAMVQFLQSSSSYYAPNTGVGKASALSASLMLGLYGSNININLKVNAEYPVNIFFCDYMDRASVSSIGDVSCRPITTLDLRFVLSALTMNVVSETLNIVDSAKIGSLFTNSSLPPLKKVKDNSNITGDVSNRSAEQTDYEKRWLISNHEKLGIIMTEILSCS